MSLIYCVQYHFQIYKSRGRHTSRRRKGAAYNDGELAFKSGASATITGNMLTTVACATIRSDKEMLEGMGRNVTPEYMK